MNKKAYKSQKSKASLKGLELPLTKEENIWSNVGYKSVNALSLITILVLSKIGSVAKPCGSVKRLPEFL